MVEDAPKQTAPPCARSIQISCNYEGSSGVGVPLDGILRDLARRLNLNMQVNGEIPGRMLLTVEKQPVWDVLVSVLADQGLEWTLEGSTLKVYGVGMREVEGPRRLPAVTTQPG